MPPQTGPSALQTTTPGCSWQLCQSQTVRVLPDPLTPWLFRRSWGSVILATPERSRHPKSGGPVNRLRSPVRLVLPGGAPPGRSGSQRVGSMRPSLVRSSGHLLVDTPTVHHHSKRSQITDMSRVGGRKTTPPWLDPMKTHAHEILLTYVKHFTSIYNILQHNHSQGCQESR